MGSSLGRLPNSKARRREIDDGAPDVFFASAPVICDELILEVLKHLNPVEICMLAAVSREWRRLARDSVLWQRLVVENFSRDDIDLTLAEMRVSNLTKELRTVPSTFLLYKELYLSFSSLRFRPCDFLDDGNAEILNNGHSVCRRNAESAFMHCMVMTDKCIPERAAYLSGRRRTRTFVKYFEVVLDQLTRNSWSGTFVIAMTSHGPDAKGVWHANHTSNLSNCVGFMDTSAAYNVLPPGRKKTFIVGDRIGLMLVPGRKHGMYAFFNGEYAPGAVFNSSRILDDKRIYAVVEAYGQTAQLSFCPCTHIPSVPH